MRHLRGRPERKVYRNNVVIDSPFLSRSQNQTLSIISWNINGVRSKLECDRVQEMFLRHGVLRFNEVKTNQKASISRFVSYKK